MTEESSRLLKVVLGMLLVLLLAGVVFFTLTKKSAQNSTPITTNQVKTPTENVAPVPISQPAPVESQNKLQELQDQLNAGTITSEEAMKQINEFNSKIQPTPVATQK